MEIRNKIDEAISFKLLETNKDGDQHFEIAVVCGQYSAIQYIWIMFEEWNSFIDQLRSLEKSRQGTATLRGITENDLTLNVMSIDRSGHMAIEGRVGGSKFFGGHPSQVVLKFAFEFDSGRLAEIVAAFNKNPRAG